MKLKLNKLSEKREGVFTAVDFKKIRYKIMYGVIFSLLLGAALITVFPIFWLLLTSFKTDIELGTVPYRLFPENINLGMIREVWDFANLGQAFLNSLMIVALAVAVSVIFNGILAFVLGIVKPKGGKLVFGVIMLGYMIPPITGMVPLFSVLSNFDQSVNWVPLALIFGANAFYLVMFKSYMESLPAAIFEAAEVDGAKMLTVFFKIIFPLSLPIIGVIAIFTATAAWNDFLLPFLLLQTPENMTVMVRIYHIFTTGMRMDYIYMTMLLSTVPLIILFLIFQKQITATVTTSGIK